MTDCGNDDHDNNNNHHNKRRVEDKLRKMNDFLMSMVKAVKAVDPSQQNIIIGFMRDMACIRDRLLSSSSVDCDEEIADLENRADDFLSSHGDSKKSLINDGVLRT